MQDEIQIVKNWLGQGSINIFGMPFAGKDTQCGVLADLFGGEVVGGGQIFRNSIIPPHVKAIMESGDLVPVDDFIKIVLPYLSHDTFAGKPLMFSSLGKWFREIEGVLQAAAAAEHPVKAVVLIQITEDIARDRHTAGSEDRGARADDSAAVFDNRLAEFREKTIPGIEIYRDKDLLIEVNGNQSPVEVTDEILGKLAAFVAAHPTS